MTPLDRERARLQLIVSLVAGNGREPGETCEGYMEQRARVVCKYADKLLSELDRTAPKLAESPAPAGIVGTVSEALPRPAPGVLSVDLTKSRWRRNGDGTFTNLDTIQCDPVSEGFTLNIVGAPAPDAVREAAVAACEAVIDHDGDYLDAGAWTRDGRGYRAARALIAYRSARSAEKARQA